MQNVPKWNTDKKAECLDKIDQNKITEIQNQFQYVQMNSHSITSVDINMICKNIGDIFTRASNENFLDGNIKR